MTNYPYLTVYCLYCGKPELTHKDAPHKIYFCSWECVQLFKREVFERETKRSCIERLKKWWRRWSR